MHVVDTPSSGKRDFNYFMQLVWYCSFCSIRNQFCVVQFILIFFLFTMFTQCPWLVHACSWYGYGLSFQELWLSYLCGGYVQCSMLMICSCSWCILWTWVDSFFHCVSAYDVSLLIILQHKLYIHAYFVPTSIYNYDLKLNTSQRLFIGGFSPKITI